MRLLATLIIVTCALAAGCTSLASRTRERDRGRDRPPVDRRDGNPEWWLDGAATAKGRTKGLPNELARTDRDSILAGVLVDSREGRPIKGVTYVRIRAAEEPVSAGAKLGLGFDTDPEGAFFIPGLIPGKTYILSVVREIDGVRVAGEAQVKPPAANIRLVVGDDQISAVTPPLPPPPGMGPFEKSSDAASIRPPLPPPPVNDPPLPPLSKENIAGTPMLPPTAAIRPPPAPTTDDPSRKADDDPPAPPMAKGGPERVPNFLVSDVLGSDWEFRYCKGQLILMEFWSTTCVPCMKAIPGMKRLQNDYGESGLEIVAVACEPEASLNARARDADDVARRKELNYKVYVERDGRVGEVQKLFDVKWVPTLVLLDRKGNVLWRGGATDTDLARVEEVIKPYLTKR